MGDIWVLENIKFLVRILLKKLVVKGKRKRKKNEFKSFVLIVENIDVFIVIYLYIKYLYLWYCCFFFKLSLVSVN